MSLVGGQTHSELGGILCESSSRSGPRFACRIVLQAINQGSDARDQEYSARWRVAAWAISEMLGQVMSRVSSREQLSNLCLYQSFVDEPGLLVKTCAS